MIKINTELHENTLSGIECFRWECNICQLGKTSVSPSMLVRFLKQFVIKNFRKWQLIYDRKWISCLYFYPSTRNIIRWELYTFFSKRTNFKCKFNIELENFSNKCDLDGSLEIILRKDVLCQKEHRQHAHNRLCSNALSANHRAEFPCHVAVSLKTL